MIDIGANLLSGQFDADRDQVIARARQAGVVAQIVTATTVDESAHAQKLCESAADLFCTAGIHPHNADATTADSMAGACAALEKLAATSNVVAIGETGLDYYRDFAKPEHQRIVCSAQLALAARLGMPVFAHDRDAWQDLSALIKTSGIDPEKIVIHCFTGDRTALTGYLELGCMIGITGWICDPKRGAGLRKLAALIPVDRVLIETDAPYLRPHNAPKDALPERSKKNRRRNEPALLSYVAETLAECMRLSTAALVERANANTQRLFPRLTLGSSQ